MNIFAVGLIFCVIGMLIGLFMSFCSYVITRFEVVYDILVSQVFIDIEGSDIDDIIEIFKDKTFQVREIPGWYIPKDCVEPTYKSSFIRISRNVFFPTLEFWCKRPDAVLENMKYKARGLKIIHEGRY